MKNILLISYTFPPYPGVGGRRWGKFAKYLTEAGYTVHVICAKNPFNQTSFYTQDVQRERIKVYTFSSCFPDILQNITPITLSEKIRYKFWLKILSLFIKGFAYDKAIFDERKIVSLARRIIKTNDIKNIITTGAPFRVNYYALKLKSEFKGVNLITDFRDPWTWGNQYSKLNTDRMNFELKMQQQVIEQSDVITVPVEPMKNYLTENAPINSHKVHVLPHAFDEEEIVIKQKYNKDSFRCVFFGTTYSDIENYFESLSKIIAKNNGKITLDIYSDTKRYLEIILKNKANKWINYMPSLYGKELFERLSEYDFVLFIHPKWGINNLSTKFYEIICSRLPIIYIGENGLTSDFISSNKLGLHFDGSTLERDFQDFINGNIQLDYNNQYNVEDYSFAKKTDELIKLFKI